MGAQRKRYVAKAVPGQGWRVWDNTRQRWWGNLFPSHPAPVLAQLNGEADPQKIAALSRIARPAGRTAERLSMPAPADRSRRESG